MLQGEEALGRLLHAVNKSHGSASEAVVRAVTAACLHEGLLNLWTHYAMVPVKYSIVSSFLRKECPMEKFWPDWDSEAEDRPGYIKNYHEACNKYGMERYDTNGNYCSSGDYDVRGAYIGALYAGNEFHAPWTLTNILQTKMCKKYFTVLPGPLRYQPEVIAIACSHSATSCGESKAALGRPLHTECA